MLYKSRSYKIHKCKENYYDIVKMCKRYFNVYLTFAEIKCVKLF